MIPTDKKKLVPRAFLVWPAISPPDHHQHHQQHMPTCAHVPKVWRGRKGCCPARRERKKKKKESSPGRKRILKHGSRNIKRSYRIFFLFLLLSSLGCQPAWPSLSTTVMGPSLLRLAIPRVPHPCRRPVCPAGPRGMGQDSGLRGNISSAN